MEVLKTIGVMFLWLIGGYVGGVPVGWFLIQMFSSNRHDKDLEAAMTSGFFIAPIIALIAAITGGILYHSRTTA